ncbi:amidohydrolase family protein [Terrabacter terrigena]|uniref:Amidohydrolase family protein n=1 Tax=Terrabacter terrigena TaxID=574718 RepID=A0ABW3N2C0_9MICO
MIIDMHMHVDDIPALGWHMSAGQCIESMDEAGIDAAVVMTITDLPEVNPDALEMIGEACAQYPGRLFPLARIHPWYQDEAVRLLKLAITEYGFRGLKLHPVTSIAHPSGEDTIRLIRTAGELGVPTLFHCGDEPMTTPLSIAPAAEACPEATVILGHMGGYFHVDEAIEVADRLPNIVLETSAMPYPEKIKEAVARIGDERVVFGSDGPVCSPVLERRKIEIAGLTAAQEERVLGLNAMRLLRLPS